MAGIKAEADGSAVQAVIVTPGMDARNRRIFLTSYLLFYFAAPVVYMGVVQASLCDKLGASATVANLPAASYLLGAFAPFVLSWVLPYRLQRAAVVWSCAVAAVSTCFVMLVLWFPFSDAIRLATVVGQGLVQGFCGNICQVYMYQCLGCGTTPEGRIRTFKWTGTLGPIFAVVGSLSAQFLLNGGVSWLAYPYDFAVLYLVSFPCLAAVAIISRGYVVVAASEEARGGFHDYLRQSIRSHILVRPLMVAWFAYLLWYFTLNGISNLSLFTREAIGREPKELVGFVMALRFGFKAVGGFALAAMAVRWGARSPLVGTVCLVGSATLWAWLIPGYGFLFCFGLMGAGELGGAYFPNYVIALSTPATGARNLAIQTLASPASAVAPVLHGLLTDHFGFRGSFIFGIAAAIFALILVFGLPKQPASALEPQ